MRNHIYEAAFSDMPDFVLGAPKLRLREKNTSAIAVLGLNYTIRTEAFPMFVARAHFIAQIEVDRRWPNESSAFTALARFNNDAAGTYFRQSIRNLDIILTGFEHVRLWGLSGVPHTLIVHQLIPSLVPAGAFDHLAIRADDSAPAFDPMIAELVDFANGLHEPGKKSKRETIQRETFDWVTNISASVALAGKMEICENWDWTLSRRASTQWTTSRRGGSDESSVMALEVSRCRVQSSGQGAEDEGVMSFR